MLAAQLDEHFRINDAKRVLVRLFHDLHINEHRESDGHPRRQRNDNAGPSSAYQRRENASYPHRYRSVLATGHEWADTETVDEETDVSSADLQGFVRCQRESQSCPAICRVFSLVKSLQNWRVQRWNYQLSLKHW